MGPYECISAGRNNNSLFALHAFNGWNCECDIIYRCSNVHRASLFTHEQCAIELQSKTKQRKATTKQHTECLMEREKKKVAWNHSYFEHMSPIWHGHITAAMNEFPHWMRSSNMERISLWMRSKLHDWYRSIYRLIDRICAGDHIMSNWYRTIRCRLHNCSNSEKNLSTKWICAMEQEYRWKSIQSSLNHSFSSVKFNCAVRQKC